MSEFMKTLAVILVLFSILTGSLFAKAPITVAAKSDVMKKEIPALVILPDDYEKSGKSYPVIYLLHGFGGNYQTWYHIKPNLPELATSNQVIFVLPDGATSWYWDSPVNQNLKYETYVAKELVDFIDSSYRTIKSPKGRAIAGLSMGGHGAMWLALRHKDVFGAAGAISGGVDIRPFPNNWDMAKNLGEYSSNKDVWDAHTVINQVDGLKNGELAIYIDCGFSDFFYQVNLNLHNKLLQMKIDHDYLARPGAHNNAYWNNAIDYNILFFKKFFSKN